MSTLIVIHTKRIIALHRGPVWIAVDFIRVISIECRCHKQNGNIYII